MVTDELEATLVSVVNRRETINLNMVKDTYKRL